MVDTFVNISRTGDNVPPRPDEGNIPTIDSGTAIFTLGFFDPPLPFATANDVKLAAPIQLARKEKFSVFPKDNEMVKLNVRIDAQIPEGTRYEVIMDWFNDDTDKFLFNSQIFTAAPSSRGFAYWNWYEVASWIGYDTIENDEILGPGTYRVEVIIRGSGVNIVRKMWFSLLAEPEPPVEETLAEKLQKWLTAFFKQPEAERGELVRNVFGKRIDDVIEWIVDLVTIDVKDEAGKLVAAIPLWGNFFSSAAPKLIGAEAFATLEANLAKLSAAEITTLARKAPSVIAPNLEAMSKEAVKRLFSRLGATPEGRIALFELLQAAGKRNAARLVGATAAASTPKTILKWLGITVAIAGVGLGIVGLPIWLGWSRKESVEPASFTVGQSIFELPDKPPCAEVERLRAALATYEQIFNNVNSEALMFVEELPYFGPTFEANREAAQLQIEELKNVLRRKALVCVPEKPEVQTATLTVTPKDDKTGAVVKSRVVIDGQLQTFTTQEGTLAPKTAPDSYPITADVSHFVSVLADDYLEETFTISIKAGESADQLVRLRKPSIAPVTGSLGVVTAPPGASILLDGQLQPFRTPTVVTQLVPKSYSLVVSLEEFKTATDIVAIEAGKQITKTFILQAEAPRPGQAAIFADSSPRGARVFIDNLQAFGTTPLSVNVQPGAHTVRIFLAGYKEVVKQLSIDAGEVEPVIAELELEVGVTPPTTSWRVNVDSAPRSAKVLVNGAFTGKFTPDFVVLPEGIWEFEVVKSGFAPARALIVLPSGEVTGL